MKFLIFGDVVGRHGRAAITHILPVIKQELKIDSVIINIENMAHGRGISPHTWVEAKKWQADVYTTGDHAWDNSAGLALLNDTSLPIIRPANYPLGVPGRGYHVYGQGAVRIAVINLQGQAFFRYSPDSFFATLDKLLLHPEIQAATIKLIDFHAEATSEKRALGLAYNGKVSAIWGTHTHVPTADAQILSQGTGYLSDVGMVGALHSILGVAPAGPLRSMRLQIGAKFEPQEDGPAEVNALELEIDVNTGKTIHIAHHRRIVNDDK